MNNIQKFESSEFGELQILLIDGKEMFPASECARMLGYSNPHKGLGDHCRSLAKREVPHPQSSGESVEMSLIPESDLFRLIVKSKLPVAERFERWVFEDVLPTIRKHGAL